MKPLIAILYIVLVGCHANAMLTPQGSQTGTPDQQLFERLVRQSNAEKWDLRHRDSVIVKVANYFMGTPYVGYTLEADGPEQLVVNLREMDCTTFAENVLAISWCLTHHQESFDDFKATLTRLRYRHGIIDQYPSRLHYFTDWLMDNQRKGLIELVTEQIGTQPFVPAVGFMSAHPDKYAALTKHPEFIEPIRQQEQTINGYRFKFIPKAEVAGKEQEIHDGDLIAIATTIEGLDIVHLGIATHQKGRLYLIHASSTFKKVVISDKPLADYLADIKKDSGILVGRLRH